MSGSRFGSASGFTNVETLAACQISCVAPKWWGLAGGGVGRGTTVLGFWAGPVKTVVTTTTNISLT